MRRNREMTRNRGEAGERAEQQLSIREDPPPPQALHHVFTESAAELQPGDILVLDEADNLGLQVEPDFFAVIACPRCGALDLISAAQYFGVTPVICGSNTCPCSFKIVDESRLVYMPVN